MATGANDPALVAKALAKAQSVESRLNALVGGAFATPVQPTIVYTSTNTIITQSANGTYTWTCPAGVYSAVIECWGAGAGGGGGSSGKGGEGGGGGAYSAEQLFVTVPGTVYSYTVGQGGSGGPGGGGTGSDGSDTFFNNNGPTGISVYAHAGTYSPGAFLGGIGGTGSGNTISTVGGNGGGDASQSTGGCGGGGSAGQTGNGNNGTDSVGGTGTAGGTGGTGPSGSAGANGGAGGNSGASGVAGSSPGAGGGGVGANSATSLAKTYNASGCRSYYGSDATGGNANNTRQTSGTMWHGGTTDGGGIANGTQKSIITFPTAGGAGTIDSDFAGGYTCTACSFKITNTHTYYSSGMSLEFRTWLATGGSPATWNGSSSSGSPTYTSIGRNQTKTYNLGTTIGQGFINGTNYGMTLGPGNATMNNNWYGYFAGPGANVPTLSITGVLGGVGVIGGAGSDGQVQITYANPPTTVVASVQPVAVTDTTGNQLAAGITALVPPTPASPPYGATPGGVTAINPSSSPAVPETWHTIGTVSSSIGSGFNISGANSGQPLQFMLGADGNVYVNGVLNCSSGTAQNSLTLFTLPSAWRPNRVCYIPYIAYPYSAPNYATTTFAAISTGGVCTIGFPATTTITAVIFTSYFPLNSNIS